MGATLSIALCTFRGRTHLADQLKSILAQQRPPDELVICDDASGDGTPELARELLSAAPFAVRLAINEHNLGSSANFSRAIGLCSSDIVVLCDQDDVWERTKLTVIEDAFTRRPGLVLFFSNGVVIKGAGEPTGYDLWSSCMFTARERRLASQQGLFHVLLRHNVVTGTAMAFRRSLCPLVLPVGQEWVQDEWIALLASAAGETAALDQALVLYRSHEAQQIGASRQTLGRQIKTARRMDRAFFEREARKFRLARQRLEALQPALLQSAALSLLEAKVEYLERRAEMRKPGAARFLPSVKLYLGGAHGRFGYGWKSLAQDCFLASS